MRRLSDCPPLLFMIQVIREQLFKVLARVINALLPVAEVDRHFQILRFLKEQRPGRRRFERPQIALPADAPIKRNPRPSQQPPILLRLHALQDAHPSMIAQPRHPRQPWQPLPLHGRMQIPHKQNINISFFYLSMLLWHLLTVPLTAGRARR
jgi:hypothetical protein